MNPVRIHSSSFLGKYIRLLRIKHWLKNGLILLPVLCNGSFFDNSHMYKAIIAFFSFSFISSSIYVINDIRDVEKDKLHKTKKNRPIANGSVSISQAKYLSVCMLLLAFISNLIIYNKIFMFSSWICLILYFILNLGYSLGLKNTPFVDIAILVSGFFLRVLYGSIVCDIALSKWMYLVIICFSFYLSLGKRRNELFQNGSKTRGSLKYYTNNFLDKNMYMCLGLTITFYALWSMDTAVALHNTDSLFSTIPLVLLICMRYSMTVENPDSSGDPVDVLLGDKILMILVVMFVLLLFFAIYATNLGGTGL